MSTRTAKHGVIGVALIGLTLSCLPEEDPTGVTDGGGEQGTQEGGGGTSACELDPDAVLTTDKVDALCECCELTSVQCNDLHSDCSTFSMVSECEAVVEECVGSEPVCGLDPQSLLTTDKVDKLCECCGNTNVQCNDLHAACASFSTVGECAAELGQCDDPDDDSFCELESDAVLTTDKVDALCECCELTSSACGELHAQCASFAKVSECEQVVGACGPPSGAVGSDEGASCDLDPAALLTTDKTDAICGCCDMTPQECGELHSQCAGFTTVQECLDELDTCGSHEHEESCGLDPSAVLTTDKVDEVCDCCQMSQGQCGDVHAACASFTTVGECLELYGNCEPPDGCWFEESAVATTDKLDDLCDCYKLSPAECGELHGLCSSVTTIEECMQAFVDSSIGG